MLITISGRSGEGKSCIANIIRNALSHYGCDPDMGDVPLIEQDIAVDILFPPPGQRSRCEIEIRIREEQET